MIDKRKNSERGCFHEWIKYDVKEMKDRSESWKWFCIHCDEERVTRVVKNEVKK